MRKELLRRYNRFKKAIDLLSKLSLMNAESIIEDYVLISSLERNIQVAVEFIIDLSNYILSETIGEIQDTYKEHSQPRQ
ncbi:HepT-like ribonuclease domain-containing protein [Staphylothermus marinus]|uniref:HepT-like ribonuclease domain-containing protein n=1 Tax=Staphylothermus marinus TaxID=2280 RepID=UPI00069B2BA1|nr:HepT-like ribonuclease domain-containing protein [Staphylothermus marinus]